MKEERVFFKNSKGQKLAGVLHIPNKKTKSIIIISHGFASNKDRPRNIKVAKTLSEAGFAVLRFDFGGCGESEDRPILIKYQIDDLNSAINYIRKKGYEKIGLLGESLGGLTSILAYNKEIRTLVLWAPITKAKIPSFLKEEKLREELNKKGFLFYKKDGRNFKILEEYLIERKSINQKEILSRIRCPVLIIHGTNDTTIPLVNSKEAINYLPRESKLEIISGASHTLDEKIDKVINISLEWFKKHLK